jgi:DNA-binding PadR family transcriptional regulator
MPRENKTKFAVLGLLAYAPLSGYDIRRIYAQSLGNFWSESYGAIYPILKRLEEEGLATREVATSCTAGSRCRPTPSRSASRCCSSCFTAGRSAPP